MIERETAALLVQDELERVHRRGSVGPHNVRMVVTHVGEHELVWMVSYQSEEYVRTGNFDAALVGGGAYLVDRVDGGLHRIGGVAAGRGGWEADYRSRIRGVPTRTAVDDLLDEVRRIGADHGRVAVAAELRRRLRALSLAVALEYATALMSGDTPADLLAIATQELVEPPDPMFTVETIRAA